MLRTHYDNLQVKRDASQEVIKGAYKYLSQKWHPDKNPHQREKAEQFSKIINQAFTILSDPALRKIHDDWIRNQEKAQAEYAAHAQRRRTQPPDDTNELRAANCAAIKVSRDRLPSTTNKGVKVEKLFLVLRMLTFAVMAVSCVYACLEQRNAAYLFLIAAAVGYHWFLHDLSITDSDFATWKHTRSFVSGISFFWTELVGYVMGGAYISETIISSHEWPTELFVVCVTIWLGPIAALIALIESTKWLFGANYLKSTLQWSFSSLFVTVIAFLLASDEIKNTEKSRIQSYQTPVTSIPDPSPPGSNPQTLRSLREQDREDFLNNCHSECLQSADQSLPAEIAHRFCSCSCDEFLNSLDTQDVMDMLRARPAIPEHVLKKMQFASASCLR